MRWKCCGPPATRNLPNVGWPNLSVYVPEYQRRQIARSKRFDLLEPYKSARIYREHITEVADRTVMLFRPAMGRDVEAANLWGNARAIWSQWDGYLEEGPGAKVKADLATRGIPLEVIHTSGHARHRRPQAVFGRSTAKQTNFD